MKRDWNEGDTDKKIKVVIGLILLVCLIAVFFPVFLLAYLSKLYQSRKITKFELRGNLTDDEIEILLKCKCPPQGVLVTCPLYFKHMSSIEEWDFPLKSFPQKPTVVWDCGWFLFISNWAMFLLFVYGYLYWVFLTFSTPQIHDLIPHSGTFIIGMAWGSGLGNYVVTFFKSNKYTKYAPLR